MTVAERWQRKRLKKKIACLSGLRWAKGGVHWCRVSWSLGGGGGQDGTTAELHQSFVLRRSMDTLPYRLVEWTRQDQRDLLHLALWHGLIRGNPAYVSNMPHSCTIAIT